MNIKLDENIPHSLSPALIALGHDVRTVVDQGLTGTSLFESEDIARWRGCLVVVTERKIRVR